MPKQGKSPKKKTKEKSPLKAIINIALGADAPSARAQVVKGTFVFDSGATACFAGSDQEDKAIPRSIHKLDKPVEVNSFV